MTIDMSEGSRQSLQLSLESSASIAIQKQRTNASLDSASSNHLISKQQSAFFPKQSDSKSYENIYAENTPPPDLFSPLNAGSFQRIGTNSSIHKIPIQSNNRLMSNPSFHSQPVIDRWQAANKYQMPINRVQNRSRVPQWLEEAEFTGNGNHNATEHVRQEDGLAFPGQINSEETIPTAIVIKNIPFNLKKETLLDLFTAMDIPKPYALNYHFDQGVFRGLAFANFYTIEETRIVLQVLNSVDVQGRKLRVELKRLLPAAERERAERVKRDRKLMEDHKKVKKIPEIDMNDPTTLGLYSQILLFRDDPTPNPPSTRHFAAGISGNEKRIIHLIANKFGLESYSDGEGEERHVVISRAEQNLEKQNFSSANWNTSQVLQSERPLARRSFSSSFTATSVSSTFPDTLSVNTSHATKNLGFDDKINSAPIGSTYTTFADRQPPKMSPRKSSDVAFSETNSKIGRRALPNIVVPRNVALNSAPCYFGSNRSYFSPISPYNGPRSASAGFFGNPQTSQSFSGTSLVANNSKLPWPLSSYGQHSATSESPFVLSNGMGNGSAQDRRDAVNLLNGEKNGGHRLDLLGDLHYLNINDDNAMNGTMQSLDIDEEVHGKVREQAKNCAANSVEVVHEQTHNRQEYEMAAAASSS